MVLSHPFVFLWLELHEGVNYMLLRHTLYGAQLSRRVPVPAIWSWDPSPGTMLELQLSPGRHLKGPQDFFNTGVFLVETLELALG